MTDKTAIRNAATVILLRDRLENPRVLMGQRGAKAAFMPNKFVFPGGAVDAEDTNIALATEIPQPCRARLSEDCADDISTPLCVAAIRELWEETGLILGHKAPWSGAPPDAWRDFAAAEYVPSAENLQFVFRAITPPGRPRRFDARFFPSMPVILPMISTTFLPPQTSYRICNGCRWIKPETLICRSSPKSFWPKYLAA